MARLDATQEFVPKEPGVSGRQGRSPEVGWEVAVRFLDKFPASLSALHLPQFDWKPGALSTVLEQERLIANLAELYSFNDNASVRRFLRENPYLLTLLTRARKKIREHFGPNVQVALEVSTDPEVADVQELFALIQARLPLEEDIDRLEQFYEEWWLDALPEARCSLTIDLE